MHITHAFTSTPHVPSGTITNIKRPLPNKGSGRTLDLAAESDSCYGIYLRLRRFITPFTYFNGSAIGFCPRV
ncbi:hypothetical protein ACFQV5_12275 [Paenibacillus sp. GCM10028914]